MHSGVKLVIGILIFLVGLYWYVPGNALGNALTHLRTVFIGVFGIVLIFLGLIVAWIEYEDLKWEAREKKEQKTKDVSKEKEPAKKK
ncbi:MAG: hypothetical protein QMD85_04735 [Candidatus Aenigmarchaeota archaeon]|nr:hypothetical protein [Candidatus Aenigmarchaeota archaeon]MDI6722869.1 hypothetical protein [Candidatus Aenigmarchaeota archaeon]